MKNYLLRFNLLVALILFFNNVEMYSSDDTPIALVKKVVRDVTKKVNTEDDWALAKTGEPLYDGGEVKTGSKSLALILFTDGSGLLRVRENSIANIYGKKENKKIDKNTTLTKGTISFDVNKQSEDEEFTFTTPTMVASIRGTSGVIKVDENVSPDNTENSNVPSVSSTLIVEEGTIEVQSTKGEKNTSTVTAGQAIVSDETGQLRVAELTEKQKNLIKSSKATELKTVKFTIDGVQYEVEYYSEEE